MSKLNAGKASILALTAVFAVAAFLLGRTLTPISAIQRACIDENSQAACDASKPDNDNGCCTGLICVLHGSNGKCTLAPKDCVGAWSNTTTCNKTCGGGVYRQIYTITQPAVGTGEPCPFTDGATRDGTTSCNTNACPTEGTCPLSCGYQGGTVPNGQGGQKTCPATSACDPEGVCPRTCGYQGGTVPNGQGGQKTCPATEACVSNTDCAYHYTNCSATCGTGTKTLVIDTQPSGDGAACPTAQTISCGELPACPTPTPNPDVCANIDGIQYSVPEGLHLDAGGRNCVSFSVPGPGGNPGGGGGGQVLGASTMAGTGGFEENLYLAIMAIGGIITTLGVANFKKASRLA